MITVKSILKSFAWTALNTVVGLAPILAILILRLFLQKDSEACRQLSNALIAKKILDDGIVMFLCCALSSAATIECFLSGMKMKKAYAGVITAFCIGMLFLVGSVFVALFFHDTIQFDIDALRFFQNILIGVSIGFCLVLKTVLYKFEYHTYG